jgi:hypothetical protein
VSINVSFMDGAGWREQCFGDATGSEVIAGHLYVYRALKPLAVFAPGVWQSAIAEDDDE